MNHRSLFETENRDGVKDFESSAKAQPHRHTTLSETHHLYGVKLRPIPNTFSPT